MGGGRSSLLCSWRHQPGFTTIFQSIALATDVDGRRVMEQPVQDRRCDNRISKDRTPVSLAFVGSQDDAAAFVSRADQLEEDRGSEIIERQVSYFVNHQELGRQVDSHPAIQAPFTIGWSQIPRQIMGRNEISSQT